MTDKSAAAALMTNIYRTAIDHGIVTAPNITLPGFEEIMTAVLPLALLRTMEFAPLVKADQQHSWEQYAKTHVSDLRGPSSLTTRSKPSNWLVADGIFQFTPDNSGKVKTSSYFPDSAYPDWLFPLWQVAPIANNAGVVMLEIHNQNRNAQLIDGLIRQTLLDPSTVHNGVTEPFQIFQDGTTQRPSTVMYSPAASVSGEVFGMNALVFTWDEMFQNVIPTYFKRVYLVLTTKTSTFTFALDGAKVAVLGVGDLHDAAYDAYGLAIEDRSILAASGYSFRVYPSRELYQSYVTVLPGVVCAVVVVLIVLTALLVLVNGYVLKRREDALLKEVQQVAVLAASRDAVLESQKQFVRCAQHPPSLPSPHNSQHLDSSFPHSC